MLLHPQSLIPMRKYELNVCAYYHRKLVALTNRRNSDLLAPLTSASDLPNHPTLSKPFTSKALTELTKHAGEMVQKERASLWRIKHLLTRLSGDNTWIPCESIETEGDFALFLDERDRPQASLLRKGVERDVDQISTGTLPSEGSRIGSLMIDAISKDINLSPPKQIMNEPSTNEDREIVPGDKQPNLGSVESHAASESQVAESRTDAENGAHVLHPEMDIDNQPGQSIIEGQPLLEETEVASLDDGVEDAEQPAPRRMRTRAQAQAASENTASSRARSISPDSGEEMFISPYFLAPPKSRPDRDLGLPQHEADDIRRLLQLYIQKQEEVCRGVQKVYDGLMKADRYRQQVMKWAKAEGHVGANRDMSDGEDWYDKEEWGLDEDLKKGQDEEEEDAATTAKKTRTRRQ